MKTIDEILTETLQYKINIKDKLSDVLDVTTWTADNRDSKLEAVNDISEEIAAQSVEFLNGILNTEVDGKTVLQWKILTEFKTGIIELLMTFREELDTQERDKLGELPVDYDWLNAAIYSRIRELSEIDTKLTPLLTNEGTIEEL
jgi:hypothetical protein